MDGSLVRRLRAAAERELPAEPVLVAYLFGSRATGRARAGSDVDLAVLTDEGLQRAQRLDLALRLPDPFERAAGTEVDLVVLNDAPLPLRGRVLQQRVVLYSRDEPLRVHWESLTMRMFLDSSIPARRLDRELLAETAAGRR